ncbi:VOC family protein [uncultured Robinsoniella sp.]|uniref:VOC family protein n=1 Tax=uncultured Robinsoniella sp. TaxID=904190 RepID=UPI00374F5DE5
MIQKIDHIVITAKDMFSTVAFYEKLGFISKYQGERCELYAGNFKINVHLLGHELFPHAKNVQTGSGDFCFEISGDIEDFQKELKEKGLCIETDVVERHGVHGAMKSIYLRDPDGNLVELSSYE